MINMAQGFDKGQFGKSMHRFEAITTGDLAPPAQLELPWILAEQEMETLTLHDNILNVFITSLPVGKVGHMDFFLNIQQVKAVQLQDFTLIVEFMMRYYRRY